MKKMKHPLFLLLSVFIISLSSCVNSDYDLDDENLDKKAVISQDGIDFPVGNIERIFIAEELRKSFDGEILGTGDETLSIQYFGEIPIELPDYSIPDIERLVTDPSPVELSGSVTLPPTKHTLVSQQSVVYKVDVPDFEDEEDWEVDFKRVNFESFNIDVRFELSNLDFVTTESAYVILTLDFPESFVLDGYENNRVLSRIPVNANGSYTLVGIPVAAYDYTKDEVNVLYSVDLDVTSSVGVTASNPSFQMIFDVNNSLVVPTSVECYITKGKNVITEKIDDFGNFHDAFGGNRFVFANPALLLTMNTNLACDFDLDLRIYTNERKQANTFLAFEKPTPLGTLNPKFTSYLLSPIDPRDGSKWNSFNINPLLDPIPADVSYEASSSFKGDAELFYNELILDAAYEINLPFDFEEISLNITNVIQDIFYEDLYDKLFEKAEDIKIQSDHLVVSVGENITIKVRANLLDENHGNIGVSIEPIPLTNGVNTDFSLEIKKEDMAKMKNARHLEFIFSLEGNGAITGNDYIDIQSVRFVSDGGIHFEL